MSRCLKGTDVFFMSLQEIMLIHEMRLCTIRDCIGNIDHEREYIRGDP